MGKTTIAWTDMSWNPIRGCTRVSEGCRNCYAERVAHRFSGAGGPYEGLVTDAGKWNGTIRVVEEHMDDPLRWKKPRRIFVNSMSDLFHPAVPYWALVRIFQVMSNAQRHTFQVLTKRPELVMPFIDWHRERFGSFYWPPNVWIGTSVEDQKTHDERVPHLLSLHATRAVTFLSCEPLLGPIDLYGDLTERERSRGDLGGTAWVIVGGESGPGARPMSPDWARDLRDQCVAAGVPFFFKQWGEWAHPPSAGLPDWDRRLPHQMLTATRDTDRVVAHVLCRLGKKRAGRVLDGRTWDEYPESAKVNPVLIDLMESEP